MYPRAPGTHSTDYNEGDGSNESNDWSVKRRTSPLHDLEGFLGLRILAADLAAPALRDLALYPLDFHGSLLYSLNNEDLNVFCLDVQSLTNKSDKLF